MEGTILTCIWFCFSAYFLKSCVLLFIHDMWMCLIYFFQVQLLDRHHLLIKFGSVDGGVRINFSLRSILLSVFFTFHLNSHTKKGRRSYPDTHRWCNKLSTFYISYHIHDQLPFNLALDVSFLTNLHRTHNIFTLILIKNVLNAYCPINLIRELYDAGWV